MEKQKNKKITFLMIAIIFITMALVYYFIMLDFSGWKKWLPVAFFLITGVINFGFYLKK